jgi:putative ABC transport system permease protein
MNPLTRGVRNAFRNSIRTFSIVAILGASIALAIIMLLARQAVTTKIESIKSSVGNTITISPAGARGFMGGGDPLAADQMSKVEKTAHVSKLTESLQDRLTSENTNLQSAIDAGSIGKRAQDTSGNAPIETFGAKGGANFTPPIMVVGTNDATDLQSSGQNLKVTSGSAFNPTKDENIALVGKDLADKNNLKVGSTFTAYNITIKVVGIFDAGSSNKFASSLLAMPLPTVQRLSNQTGDVTSATATVDSITNLDSTTKSISSTLGSAADVTSDQSSIDNTIKPLESIKSTTLISLIGAIIAGAAVILLTMIMIVRERRREVGVLKAIGATNRKIVTQFMTEAVTLTLLASVIGLVFGVIGANPITKSLVTNSTNSNNQDNASLQLGATPGMTNINQDQAQHSRAFGGFRSALNNPQKVHSIGSVKVAIGWQVILYGIAAALAIAVIGSAIPAWLIAKIRPAEVMRAE